MTNYYFDIETDTEGREKPDPSKDKIVTIQYQPFYNDSGNQKEPLTTLKSWNSSEESILNKFLNFTGWLEDPPRIWNFIPVGINLSYDLLIILRRSEELLDIEIPLQLIMHEIPKLDLKSILVIANKGNFKGSSLDNFSKKSGSGQQTRLYIKNKEWDNLLNYIKQEAEAFLDVYKILVKNIPTILKKL